MSTDSEDSNRPVIYSFDEFEIDLAGETLSRSGERLNINRRMFQVLCLLIERQGEIVAKDEFFEKVWNGNFVEENNLTVTIRSLRKVLGDDAKLSRFIENIPRKGYRFIAAVERKGSVSKTRPEVVLSRETTDKPPKTIPSGQNRVFRLVTAAAAILIIALLAFAAIEYRGVFSESDNAGRRINSVAVLPFESVNADSEYVASGLTDGLISRLSKVQGLRVIDRNSSSAFKDKRFDPIEIAAELNVGSAVRGRIEQNGEVVILNVEFVELPGNTSLWRQQFRRGSAELYAIQEEVSQAIIERTLAPAVNSLAQPPNRDPEAFKLFIKGQYFLNKRENSDLMKAIEYFKSAVDIDPAFSDAYVGLANAYTLASVPKLGVTIEGKNSMIRSLIKKALEIDPNNGDASAASAINKCYYEWDWEGAENDYRRAIALSPGSARAHHWYAEFLGMQGRFDESFTQYDQAAALDPLSLPVKTDQAFNYYYAQDYDSAIANLNKIHAANPGYEHTYQFLAEVYIQQGNFPEAINEVEKLFSIQSERGEGSPRDLEKARIYVAKLRKGFEISGERGYWQAELTYGVDPLYERAVAYAKLGDSDRAFMYLERALKERNSAMVWLKVTPELAGLRADPRFSDLLRHVGLTP